MPKQNPATATLAFSLMERMCMRTDSYNSSWPDKQHSYVARPPLAQATELSAYEYWNGASWQTERLTNVGEKESI